jgi:hypothetical protein
VSFLAWIVLGLFTTFGASGITGFNLYSLLVAVIGAIRGPCGASRSQACIRRTEQISG